MADMANTYLPPCEPDYPRVCEQPSQCRHLSHVSPRMVTREGQMFAIVLTILRGSHYLWSEVEDMLHIPFLGPGAQVHPLLKGRITSDLAY